MSSFYGKGVNTESEETFNLHILNGQSHTTNQERAYWNNKVTALFDEESHTIIFSKADEGD